MIGLKSVPSPIGGLCIRELGGAVIIITETGDELHSLDETGSFIWRNIDGTLSAGDIVDRLCAEYDVERSRAETDTLMFLETLEDKNLITV
ncbi:MAG: PqqD family protein [Spirochaetes bacterium]|nr:PqqD family protein [Spirochaetota bacterium]